MTGQSRGARPGPLSAIDADELARTLRPPVIRVGNRMYRGRLLSYQEFIPFQRLGEKMREAAKANEQGLDPEALVEMFMRYGNLVFGRRWWEVWRIGTNPTRRLMALPPAAMMEAFRGLFRVQARAMRMARPDNLTSTSAPPLPDNAAPSGS